jgi:hypothetical protein
MAIMSSSRTSLKVAAIFHVNLERIIISVWYMSLEFSSWRLKSSVYSGSLSLDDSYEYWLSDSNPNVLRALGLETGHHQGPS